MDGRMDGLLINLIWVDMETSTASNEFRLKLKRMQSGYILFCCCCLPNWWVEITTLLGCTHPVSADHVSSFFSVLFHIITNLQAVLFLYKNT